MLCQIFSYDFPEIRILPKIFLRSFENMAPELFDIDNTRDTFDCVTCSCGTLRLHHVNLIV